MRLTSVDLIEALLALLALGACLILLLTLLTPAVSSHRGEHSRVERWTSTGAPEPTPEAVPSSPPLCEEPPMFQDAWLAPC